MKLLVIGGTSFLGRHLVQSALAQGHELTLFHRGRTNPGVHAGVESILGDRHSDLSKLGGRRWDAVVDTCGYVPLAVSASAQALARAVERYCFISTISVYPDITAPGLDETATVSEPIAAQEVTAETYGPLKVGCERAVEAALPGRALIVRPGLIVGPYDPSDRFTYWPARIARGGTVLAPGRPDRRVQFVDGRDLGAWVVRTIESNETGTFNATGPDRPLTMRELLEACRTVGASAAEFRWVADDVLVSRKSAPYSEIPLWIPGADDAVDCRKARSKGLTFRPLADTVRDTLAWDRTRPAGSRRSGLTPERERELLA
jgi:2'-hydroxyisoflavone reductase